MRLYGKIIHERQRVDYRPYRRTNHTLTSLLHLYASATVHYEIFGVKLLNIYVCAIKHFYCRQIFIMYPDVILNTKIMKTSDSHNGSLTHHSENTKFRLIILIKQRRVLLANPTNTASQNWRKPLIEAKDIASGPNPLMKALWRGHHWVWGRNRRREIKEKSIAINRDWVNN